MVANHARGKAVLTDGGKDARVYARAGLVGDAVAAYDELLRAREISEARVTLGDLYSTLGLLTLAERAARRRIG